MLSFKLIVHWLNLRDRPIKAFIKVLEIKEGSQKIVVIKNLNG
jgi:hypothetical protein